MTKISKLLLYLSHFDRTQGKFEFVKIVDYAHITNLAFNHILNVSSLFLVFNFILQCIFTIFDIFQYTLELVCLISYSQKVK